MYYKLLLDGQRWLDDPNDPRKSPDSVGGLNSVLVIPETLLASWNRTPNDFRRSQSLQSSMLQMRSARGSLIWVPAVCRRM